MSREPELPARSQLTHRRTSLRGRRSRPRPAPRRLSRRAHGLALALADPGPDRRRSRLDRAERRRWGARRAAGEAARRDAPAWRRPGVGASGFRVRRCRRARRGDARARARDRLRGRSPARGEQAVADERLSDPSPSRRVAHRARPSTSPRARRRGIAAVALPPPRSRDVGRRPLRQGSRDARRRRPPVRGADGGEDLPRAGRRHPRRGRRRDRSAARAATSRRASRSSRGRGSMAAASRRGRAGGCSSGSRMRRRPALCSSCAPRPDASTSSAPISPRSAIRSLATSSISGATTSSSPRSIAT